MEVGALLLAIVQLVLAVLDDRRATRPQRERAKVEKEYQDDVHRNAQAAATGDAATLTMDFEAERQAAIRRGDLDPRGDAGGLQQLP